MLVMSAMYAALLDKTNARKLQNSLPLSSSEYIAKKKKNKKNSSAVIFMSAEGDVERDWKFAPTDLVL